MAQDQETLRIFQQGTAGIDVVVPVTGHFDFGLLRISAEENERGIAELVDVGGGHGAVLKQILDAYPEELSARNAVLQDREDIISLAKESGVLPGGVKLMVHGFMTDQPVRGKPRVLTLFLDMALIHCGTGAQAGFMRMILHEYAGGVGTEILKRLATAMDNKSRVLACEMLLPARVGEIDFPAAVMDQAVMTMGGKERTAQRFRKMFEEAGLELVKAVGEPQKYLAFGVV